MSFLEDFQANLESLPNMLQRKYTLLRDLDKSLQDIQHQNEQRCEQEIEEMKHEIKSGNITPNASNIRFSDEALDEQKHAVRIADEKVALAVQAYDLVDAHIQQLDQYLRKIDEELRSGKFLLGSASSTSIQRESVAVTGSAAQNLNSNVKSRRGSESGRGGRKKGILGEEKLYKLSNPAILKTRRGTANAAAATANPTSMDLDLPVDPNEPTYCFCNQVSYGEMVGCDNPDCKIEWFHYGCVGLKEQPKGKWYCSECVGMQNRRKGK
ncbi:hypothetical protein TEA_002813 [Camellia sinensis var. sinensis]|uniref:PHD finger protein ING n=1 Tax=Camellia sinensis var. sinensis TaxID=542762 RepID=A0A4S4DF35_CAMSN|nr:hypothetical protein TEA_002813 [Camellia sinensis var. sinensis]